MQNEIPIQSFDLVKRATIRVADTTEESGRVTADEVNLDRFHNRIRKEGNLIKLDFGVRQIAF